MFGSKRKKVVGEVVSRLVPIFKFESMQSMFGEVPNEYYSDSYVLGFYNSAVITLTIAALGVNPAQDNPKYDKNEVVFVLMDVTHAIFGDRASAMLAQISALMNNGNIVDSEFSKGAVNAKKFIFLTLGMKPLDKDADIEQAQAEIDSGAFTSLGRETLAGHVLSNLFTSYVTKKYFGPER